MAVYIWLYQSRETRPMQKADLQAILEVSRRHNGERGITGMLLYHAGRFTQVIEGGEDDIRALKDRICRDERHTEVATLAEGWRDARIFAQWSMAFHSPSPDQQADLDARMPIGWARKTLESIDDTGGLQALFARMAEWASTGES